MMIKVKDFFLALLNRETFVYSFIKISIVFFGKKRRDNLQNGVDEEDKNSNMLKIK